MKKSFKKSIAVLLAVLMVVCAFPLTAFAAEKPNVNLQFGVLSVSKTDKRTYSTNRGASNNASTISGLMSAKLDYNKSAGTITDSADSYTYAVGDYFTATVLLENVSQLAATQVAINYSSNIVPAGICNGEKDLYGAGDEVGTVSDKFKAGEPILAQSGDAIYNTTSTVEEFSYIDMTTKTIYASFAVQDRSNYVSTASTSIGANTFSNTAVIATFAFKITAEGPISFSLANTTDVDDAYYLGTLENGGNVSEYITYAPTENAGSTGLNFMGGNEYVATTKYTVTFKNAEGSVISSAEYDEGAAVTVPELPATTKDNTNHYTYSWDVEPSLTAVANATYQVVKTGAAHTWDEGVVTKEPTATENGEKTFTCTFDGCGATKTEAIPATGETHTHSYTWVYNGDAVYNTKTDYTDGTITGTCECGDTKTETVTGTALLRCNSYSLILDNSLTINFKITKANVTNFSNLVVKADTQFDAQKVYNAPVKEDSTTYQYPVGMPPQYVKDDINVVVYSAVEKDGQTVEVWGPTYTRSVLLYATTILNNAAYASDSATEKNKAFRTMLVDILNYGSAAQVKANYCVDELANAGLTETQKSWASADIQTWNTVKNYHAVEIENATARFNAGGLKLDDAVVPRMTFSLKDGQADINDIVMEVKVGSDTFSYNIADNPDNFVYISTGTTPTYGTENKYYFYFTNILANQMYDTIEFTVKKNGVAISDTATYSVESFVQQAYSLGSTTQVDKDLYMAMMKYGKAAVTYGRL